jgi:hypothetical protein
MQLALNILTAGDFYATITPYGIPLNSHIISGTDSSIAV